MGIKIYRPTTPSRRQLVQIHRAELWKGKPFKSLRQGLSRQGGRNNLGHITSRHRGGGHKRSYRIIDFKRNKFDIPATVERLEYDPCRTSFIALLLYEDGTYSYILAPQKLKVGDTVLSGERVDIKPGNAMRLKNIPVGTILHNVELKPGKGGQLARAAGMYIQLVERDWSQAQIKLSSGEIRCVPSECMASIGALSNPNHSNRQIGKAGGRRWQDRRPVVRGVAMNPVDHPHGGGEGRSSGGRHPVTPWGKPTKGKKTRNNKRTESVILHRRKP